MCACRYVCALGWAGLPSATSLSVMNLPTSWRLIKIYARPCGHKQTWAVGHSFACHPNQLTAHETWIFKPFCRNPFLVIALTLHHMSFSQILFSGGSGWLSPTLFILLGPSSLQICNFKFHCLVCWKPFCFSYETVELYISHEQHS